MLIKIAQLRCKPTAEQMFVVTNMSANNITLPWSLNILDFRGAFEISNLIP